MVKKINVGYVCLECNVAATVLSSLLKTGKPPEYLPREIPNERVGTCGFCNQRKTVTAHSDFSTADYGLIIPTGRLLKEFLGEVRDHAPVENFS